MMKRLVNMRYFLEYNNTETGTHKKHKRHTDYNVSDNAWYFHISYPNSWVFVDHKKYALIKVLGLGVKPSVKNI